MTRVDFERSTEPSSCLRHVTRLLSKIAKVEERGNIVRLQLERAF
jgi:hypothetical protein